MKRSRLSSSQTVLQASGDIIKLKSSIISNQSKTWELELTLLPNGAVKLGLYQYGILLEEEFIEKIYKPFTELLKDLGLNNGHDYIVDEGEEYDGQTC